MGKQKRLTIGVMIHYLDNDYSKILLRGITAAAEDLDVNLVIMPGRSLNCQLYDLKNTAYEFQYNTIYSYACAHNLDALIVSAGTVGQFVTREEFKSFLDGFKDLPII
ncbi:MAG: GGDEF domain-containing protein, partial [Oscillospiraceae bacterium]|nr:GGDEF domain-containing protein [Oscillospiraceae bacterium]